MTKKQALVLVSALALLLGSVVLLRERLSGFSSGGHVEEAALLADGEVRQCGVSHGSRLCISVPDVTVRGVVTVTTSVTGWPSQVRFSWGRTVSGGDTLLTAFGSPWALRWPTTALPDGTGYLVARAYSSRQGLGDPVSIRLTIANGAVAAGDSGSGSGAVSGPGSGAVSGSSVGSVSGTGSVSGAGAGSRFRDWAARFRPRTALSRPLWFSGGRPVIAAVGDGGDGGYNSAAVAELVRRSPANVLLYLGDIYERGTAAEWETNFGSPGWSGSSGSSGRDWGRLVPFTQPVLGNHEAHNMPVWRSYWRGRPNWSTFVFGGVRFLLLDSECPQKGCPAQERWARRVLSSSRESCVVAAWHRPVISPGPEAPWMASLWRLVAEHGGDLVLNGHQHQMGVYRPMNGALQADRSDSHLVQIISGSGGHILHRDRERDRRGAWQTLGVPGALFLSPGGGRISWEFRDTQGRVVRGGSGSVRC
jgi:hypothetical protein